MTRNEIIRSLLGEYSKLRQQDEQEREERLRSVLTLCPDIGALMERRSAAMRAHARTILRDPHQAPDSLARTQTEIASINRQIERHLAALGLPGDYLKPVYHCAQCEDTGYVGDPVKRFCPCFEQKLMTRMYEGANLAWLDEENFEHFDENVFPDQPLPGSTLTQRAAMGKIRDLCLQYATDFPQTQRQNLLLLGESGLGKTFLLNSICKRVLDRGHTALKVTAYRMLETMRQYHLGGAQDRNSMDMMLSCELLLIDDLGTEPLLRNITLEYLFTLLNERLISGQHTVIASNLSPVMLKERYGERILSRLMDTRHAAVIRFAGSDVRISRGKGV